MIELSRGKRGVSRIILRTALAMTMTAVMVANFLASEAGRGASSAAPERGRSACWILMDIESFFCAPCLQPLLDFCRALPARVQEERVKGILAYGAPEGRERSERRMLIVRKKWQGFKSANGLRFSAVVDSGHFFQGILTAAVVVLLFDEERQMLKKYSLPLRPGQLEEITGSLLN